MEVEEKEEETAITFPPFLQRRREEEEEEEERGAIVASKGGGGGVVLRYTPTARHGGSVTLTVNTPSAFFLQRWTQFNFVSGCLDMSST